MKDEELSRDGHERLVEVLLEEQFRGVRSPRAASPASAPVSRWLAAALVVLGLSAVLGAALLRRGDPGPEGGPASAQGQEQGQPLHSAAELQTLLHDVVRVRLRSRALAKTETGPREPVASIDDAAQARAFAALVPALADDAAVQMTTEWTAGLEFELADRRVVRAMVRLGRQPVLYVPALAPAWLTKGPFLDALEKLHERALANLQSADAEFVHPKTAAECQALLQQVREVRVQVMELRERPDFLHGDLLISAPGSAGAGPVADATTTLTDPERVREFLAALPPPGELAVGESSVLGALQIDFVLQDGRRLRGASALDGSPWLQIDLLQRVQFGEGRTLEALRALQNEALANVRIARGVAFTLDELARVPATAIAVQCPPLPPGEVEKRLGRFARLERVDQVIQTTLRAGAPFAIDVRAPARLAEFACLPHLRHMRLSGAGLTDLDVLDLPRLPSLRSMRIDGGLQQLTEPGWKVLAGHLDALELIDVAHGPELVRAAVARGRLQKLALCGVELPDADFAALVAMPSLVYLDLTGVFWTDAHLTRLAKSPTHLATLRLRFAKVTVPGLRQLGELRTLRELDLRQADRLGDDARELTKSLPDCRIRWSDEPRDDEPFAGYQSTRR